MSSFLVRTVLQIADKACLQCGVPEEDAYVMSDRDKGSRRGNVFGIYDGTKYNNDSDDTVAGAKTDWLADLTGKIMTMQTGDGCQQTSSTLKICFSDQCWWMADREIKSVGKIATSGCSDGPAGLKQLHHKGIWFLYPSEVHGSDLEQRTFK